MKSNPFGCAARTLAVLLLMASVTAGALAQIATQTTFKGVMNAYTPPTATTGPYEIRGLWSLTLKDDSTKADFSADVDMALSEGWALMRNGGNLDPAARGAHTHHLRITDAEVMWLSNGFRVTGTVTVTVNGGPAPATVSPSPAVIEITGGSQIKYSNFTLTFPDGSPGSKHFGSEALPGVVRSMTVRYIREKD